MRESAATLVLSQTEELDMHAFLQFFSALPQFEAQHLFGTVTHIGTGCVLSKHESDEPKHRDTLMARWPGQHRDEVCPLGGYNAVRFYGLEAKALGFPESEIESAMSRLLEALKARD